MTPRQGRQAGFSLVELLVVVAIIVLLGAAASVGMNEMRQSSRADTAAERIVSILQQARLRALSQRVDQQVVLDYANQVVTDVFNEDHAFAGVTIADYICGACGLGGNNGSTETVTFTARGTMSSVAGGGGAAGAISVLVSAPGSSKQFIIMVNLVGGRIDVRRGCNAGVCA